MNEEKNMSAEKLGRHKRRNDLILIVSLLLIVSLVGAVFFFFRKEGDTVRVTVDGKLYGVYSLSEDLTVDIRTGENGEHLNRLIIINGKAYVEEASCPDGICAAHRPIFRDGESIVCLPNRVVITVHTEGVDDAPDIVA